MPTILDEIEAELKQISPWPWEALSDNESFVDKNGEILTPQDAAFALKSPKRLSALCAYVRAAEAWIGSVNIDSKPDYVAMCFAALQAARRELGL